MIRKFDITVDRREKQQVADLLKHYGWSVDVDHLVLGDITSPHCLIERKEFNDLVSSVIDRRIFSQSQRLMYDQRPSFLLVHGCWNLDRNVTEKQIGGAIASLMVRNANPTLVFLCQDKKQEAANFAMSMYIAGKICEKVEEGKFLKPKLWKKWQKPKVPMKVDKLAKLLGVPVLVAARALKRYGSIRAVINAGAEGKLDVEGIGDVRSSSIQFMVT